MAAPTLEEIANALEVRLRHPAVPNLRAENAGKDGYNVSGQASVAIVGVPPIQSYRDTMGRARYTLNFPITVLVSKDFTREAIRKLLAFASPTGESSIRAAIEGPDPGQRTLGGLVEECVVDSFDPLGEEQVAQIGYYGGLWSVRVVASGKD